MEMWQFVVLLIAILSSALGVGVAWGRITSSINSICKAFAEYKVENNQKVSEIQNKVEDHLSGMDGKHKVV